MSSLGGNDLNIVITFRVLWSICLSYFLAILRMPPRILGEVEPGVYPFDVISAAGLGFEKHSRFKWALVSFKILYTLSIYK